MRIRAPKIVQRPSVEPDSPDDLTWKQLFVLSQEGNYARQEVIRTLRQIFVVVFVFMVAGGFFISKLLGNQTEISNNQIEIQDQQQHGISQRQAFFAEDRWLECHPETPVTVTDPTRIKLCAGYTTLLEAYRTERDRGS